MPIPGENPFEVIVRDFPSPEIFDGLLVETWDTNKGPYAPIPIGTRIPEGVDSIYAGYELVHQKTTGDFRSVQRFWCNAPVNQDLYNAEVDNDAQDPTVPIYTRRYVERRPQTERTMGTALKAVIGAVVTSGGSGYLTAPTVTFTGGGGTGAAAQAIIYRGTVVYIRITAEGTGYTSAPAAALTGGGGSGAGCTPYIQSPTAVLTMEKVDKLPADDPRFGLYDLVTRVYTTLPGAILTEWDQDDETQVNVKTTYQIVAASSVTAPSATNGILVSYKKIDAQRTLKIVRDFTAFLSFFFNEQKFGADQFPALFDFSTYLFTDACGAFSQLRSALSAKTQIRTHVTYTSSKQTYAGLVLLPKSLMLGRGFQINQQVLVDDYTFTFIGTCTDTVSGTGSSPTYSVYVGTIQGTEQLVAGESVLWKAGIYRNTEVYEIML